jgi:cell division protein FtsW
MANRSAHFILLAVAALLGIGLVMLASTSVWTEEGQEYALLKRQGIAVTIGVLGATFFALFDYRLLKRWWPLIFIGCCIMLSLCFTPMGLERNGETRWIRLPILGQVQPSETAKFAIVVALAAWFSQYQAEIRGFWRGFVIPSALLGVPIALIFFEKDMGTAVALGAAGFCLLLIAGTRLVFLVPSALVGAAGFVYFVMADAHRMARITAFQNLEVHKLGLGHQQWRGLLAFGNGGLDGLGLGNGAEKHGYLPFAHTDFIFPMIGEELGLWFTLGCVLCYVLIAVFGMLIAINAADPFGRLLAAGATCAIIFPAILNIGVTTAVLPNTGLPLPFVSYGGSNLFFTLMVVGLLISVHRRGISSKRAELPVIKERKLAIRL